MPELEKTEVAIGVTVLQQKIAELREGIRFLAAEGATFECDVLHGRIGTLEEAMAILADEVDPVLTIQESREVGGQE